MKLCVPQEVLNQHLVVLGKTGAGKSSALRHVVEHLLRHKKRICIVDPKGDWWGLKSSADGKSAGFPVIAFGNFKEEQATDIPINPQSGKHVAELITSGNRPCIIGFRGWMPGQMTDFWIDFASTLFNSSQGEMYVVIDEVHNFAPKGKVLDPKAGKVLHWTNRLLSEGRGLGLIFLIASQRPQKVHNDTLTCCETLVAMRVNHAADRQASKDWIDGCGNKEQGTEVLNNLAQLARGEAYVWSPEAGFGPKRLKFPMFETFDSFAPPQLQHKISESGWPDVDLDAVKVKLQAVIEEAKGNDPRELKKQIAELKRELANAPTETVTKEVLVADQAAIRTAVEVDRRLMRGAFVAHLHKVNDEIMRVRGELSAIMEIPFTEPGIQFEQIAAPRVPPPHPRPVPARLGSVVTNVTKVTNVTNVTSDTSDLSGGAKKLVSALLAYPDGLTRGQARILCGFAERTLTNYVSELNGSGVLIKGNGTLKLTPSAAHDLAYLGTMEVPDSTRAVLDLWRERVSGGAYKLLDLLVKTAAPVSRTDAMEACSFAERTLTNYVSELSTAGLLVRSGQGTIAANKEALFL